MKIYKLGLGIDKTGKIKEEFQYITGDVGWRHSSGGISEVYFIPIDRFEDTPLEDIPKNENKNNDGLF